MEFANEKLELEALGFPMWLNYNDYENDCINVMRLLNKEPHDLFSTERARNIHEAYKYLVAKGAAPNEANIRQQLISQDKWDDTYTDFLEEALFLGKANLCMAAGMPGSQFMEFLLQDLRTLRWRRNLKNVIVRASEAMERANDGTFKDLALDAVAEMQLAYTDTGPSGGDSFQSIDEAFEQIIREAREMRDSKGVQTINTGLPDIDNKLRGMKPGDLVVVAGRTSMGKTALALNIALNNARKGIGVAIFSLEMTNSENARRILSRLLSIRGDDLRAEAFDETAEERIRDFLRDHPEVPIFFDDKPASARDITAQCEELANTLPIGKRLGLVIVDHLQLLGVKDSTRFESRNRQLSQYTNELKALAKTFNCVVVALSQVNRTSQREQRPPILADLRESGTIEENADSVLGIYRKFVDDELEDPHAADIAILKNRHGGLGKLSLRWTPWFMEFSCLSLHEGMM